MGRKKRPLYLRHLFVSLCFWVTFNSIFPGCSEADRLLHQHFLLSGNLDSCGGVITTWKMLSSILDPAHRFTVAELLHGWAERQGVQIRIGKHSRYRGRASTVSVQYTPELLEAAHKEQCRIFLEKRWEKTHVNFVTGEPLTPSAFRKQREMYHNHVRSTIEETLDHPAKELLRYLNELPTRTQQKIAKANLVSTHQMLLMMPRGKMKEQMQRNGEIKVVPDKYRLRHDYTQRTLYHIAQYPYTRYKCVEGSPRLFSDGMGPLCLPRDFRKRLYGGCWEADLKCAQLAILSALVDSPKMQEFLGGGGDWWHLMQEHCGVRAKAKPALKIATYAICFGATRKYVRYLLICGDAWTKGIGGKAADKFLNHPLVVELFERRDQLLGSIAAEGGMLDAFGRMINLSQFQHRNNDEQKARSVLAYVAQSWELRIMLSVLPVIQKLDRISLVGWLHDGCILRITGKEIRQSQYRRELKAAVQTVLREISAEINHNINTYLDVEQLPITVTTAGVAVGSKGEDGPDLTILEAA